MKDKFLAVCLTLSVVFLFTFGIALIVISYLPLNEIKPLFDHLTPDGDIKSFSVKHLKIPRLYGILACVASGLIYIKRRKVLQYISNIYDFLLKPDIIFNFIKDFKGGVKTGFLIKPSIILALIFNFIKDFKEGVKKEDKIHTYTFILIMLLAITVRIFYLFQPLRNDETMIFTMTVYDVTHGVKGLIQFLSTHIDGMHTFYEFLVYLTYKFIGSEQRMWVIRLPALFAGILLVPASYMLIRFFYNKRAALLTAGIVAASPPLIFWSTNGRGYSVMGLIFLLIFTLGAYLKKNNNIAGWYLFAILSAIGCYTITIFLFPLGVVITWLILSILFEDKHLDRGYLVRNLFFSIALTALLVFMLYSPVIFLGGGLGSLFKSDTTTMSQTWMEFFYRLPSGIHYSFKSTLKYWFDSMPAIISILLAIGFFTSLIFNKKLTAHRVPVVLAVPVWMLIVFLVFKIGFLQIRYNVYLLPLCIGLASAGIVYLSRPVELACKKYCSGIFITFVMVLSFGLTLNKLSEPYLTIDEDNSHNRTFYPVAEIQNFDESGNYIEFEYINAALKYYLRSDYSGKKKVLIIFPSSSTTDFWISRLDKYCGEYFCKNYFIYDFNFYLHEDPQTCHRLYVLSSQSGTTLAGFLEKKGLSVSDYSDPQLMHRFVSANIYKMDRIKDCKI